MIPDLHGPDWKQRATISIRETAAITGLSPAGLYRLIASGQLDTVKIGRRRMIRPSTLDAFLNERTSGGKL